MSNNQTPHADLAARLRRVAEHHTIPIMVEAADALAALGDTAPREEYDDLRFDLSLVRSQRDSAERERDEARADRDALAHVIEQAPHALGCRWDRIDARRGPDACTCYKSTAPAVSLALHDAEVKAQALEEAADAGTMPTTRGPIRAWLHTCAAAIREEAGS